VNNSIIGNFKKIINTFMGSFENNLLKNIIFKKKKVQYKPLLYIGLGAELRGCFFKLPKFIKRPPFNLIFLDLTNGKLPIINKNNIFYQLIDFDVA
jgi:hypothetical protein